jgi:hypothetical protein
VRRPQSWIAATASRIKPRLEISSKDFDQRRTLAVLTRQARDLVEMV